MVAISSPGGLICDVVATLLIIWSVFGFLEHEHRLAGYGPNALLVLYSSWVVRS